jgi:DNA-binding response OmpR family regulator
MNPVATMPPALRACPQRILVIEDDQSTSSEITQALEDYGFAVQQAFTGWQGLSQALGDKFDAIVLDIMLPEIDGFSVLSTLRNVGLRTPILLLSALAAVDTRVKGLSSGADDYLVKPFYFAELTARLDMLLRRLSKARNGEVSSINELKLDTKNCQAIRRGIVIDLKPRESKLLAYLIEHAGHVVTRSMLFEAVWNYHVDVQSNVVDIHIGRVRRKISLDGQLPQLIHTVRGEGWTLHAPA